MLPHWNWPGQGQDIPVWAYSNCEEVELFLNGQSLGRKPMPSNSHLQWNVNYAPGAPLGQRLQGRPASSPKTKSKPPAAPAAIKLTPDRASINADGEDISILKVAVTDAAGPGRAGGKGSC